MSSSSPLWKKLPSLPDAEGFAGSYAGTHHDILIVAGGTNFPDPQKPMWDGGKKTWTDLIFTLSSPEAEWEIAGKLPTPYGYGTSVTLPEGLLCIGGSDASGHQASVYLVSITNEGVTTQEYPALPHPLAYSAATVLDGKVYLMGGCLAPGEQDCTSEMLIFDPKNQNAGWQAAPALPARGRFLHQMASANGKIYVLGGVGLISDGSVDGKMNRELLTEAWSFSPEDDWQQLPNLPHPVAAAPTPAPVSFDGDIYLLGGDDGTYAGFTPPWEHPGFHNQSLRFDTKTQTWHDSGAVSDPGAVLPCTMWQGNAILVNGERRPGKRSNHVWSISINA
ncbi:MAG: hypothetical protein RR607_07455 [Akkermansia sp.]